MAGDLVEGDVLRREARRGRNDDGIGNPFGVGDRPLQHLHAAQTAAHCRCPALNAQMIGEARLAGDPIAHRDYGEVRTPLAAGVWVMARRASTAVAAA